MRFTVMDPELVLVVPPCSKLALFSRVKELPASTVKAPLKVTLNPDATVTVALFVNRNEQPEILAPIVPVAPSKTMDFVDVGVPFDQLTPPSVVVVVVNVTTAEPLLPVPTQPPVLVTETKL